MAYSTCPPDMMQCKKGYSLPLLRGISRFYNLSNHNLTAGFDSTHLWSQHRLKQERTLSLRQPGIYSETCLSLCLSVCLPACPPTYLCGQTDQETFQLKVNLEDLSCNSVTGYSPGIHKTLGSIPSTTHTYKVKLSIIQLRELFYGDNLITNARTFSLYHHD